MSLVDHFIEKGGSLKSIQVSIIDLKRSEESHGSG